jgi:hypothetical protein
LSANFVSVCTRSVPLPAPSCSTSSRFPTTTADGRIGELYADPRTSTFAELLIDAEDDRFPRAELAGGILTRRRIGHVRAE